MRSERGCTGKSDENASAADLGMEWCFDKNRAVAASILGRHSVCVCVCTGTKRTLTKVAQNLGHV
ncbi:hypothetical protein BKA67DRAFT_326802 [Truncatella angustata]|uniref:Uncharacterized protein n=1 Tax=Truncatella angustata TaxID=152316 RepID=A0A9P8ZY31_9PEZI|nr:uncharacterized protein BKA67DRAFT_326802 [Truncatella angustata]KAH6653628.1 hypothetical protein BKA67DRAFT_326802 [Truncatella angustata]